MLQFTVSPPPPRPARSPARRRGASFGDTSSYIAPLSTGSASPLSFSETRRQRSYSYTAATPVPLLAIPQLQAGLLAQPSPSPCFTPLSASLFLLSRDFPLPPPAKSVFPRPVTKQKKVVRIQKLAVVIESTPRSALQMDTRNGPRLPGALVSRDSLNGPMEEMGDSASSFTAGSSGHESSDTVSTIQSIRRSVKTHSKRSRRSSQSSRSNSSRTRKEAVLNIRRRSHCSDNVTSDSDNRIARPRSSTSRRSFSSFKHVDPPQEQRPIGWHKRSVTSLSNATGKETLYEDAMERLSGNEADDEEGSSRSDNIMGLLDTGHLSDPLVRTDNGSIELTKPASSQDLSSSSSSASPRSGRVRLSFKRYRSPSPLQSPTSPMSGSASPSLTSSSSRSRSESFSPISPVDSNQRIPSALARHLSTSTSSSSSFSFSEYEQMQRSASVSRTGSGPRTLLLLSSRERANSMTSTQMAQATTAAGEIDPFEYEGEMETLKMLDKKNLREMEMDATDLHQWTRDRPASRRESEDGKNPYAHLYEEITKTPSSAEVLHGDEQDGDESEREEGAMVQVSPSAASISAPSATITTSILQTPNLETVAEESYIDTEGDEEEDGLARQSTARNIAVHPYAFSNQAHTPSTSNHLASMSSILLPDTTPAVQYQHVPPPSHPSFLQWRNLNSMYPDPQLEVLGSRSSYSPSIASFPNIYHHHPEDHDYGGLGGGIAQASTATLGTQNSAQEARIGFAEPLRLEMTNRPPIVSRFSETGLEVSQLHQQQQLDSAQRARNALGLQQRDAARGVPQYAFMTGQPMGVTLPFEDRQVASNKSNSNLRSLGSRPSLWFLKPSSSDSIKRSRKTSAPSSLSSVRSLPISAPVQVKHICSGALNPHPNRESPFGRRAASPVQGYVSVPHVPSHHSFSALSTTISTPSSSLSLHYSQDPRESHSLASTSLISSPPSMTFASPTMSSTSSHSDHTTGGPQTPHQVQQDLDPMQDFWAVSFAEAEAGEEDFVAPHGVALSATGIVGSGKRPSKMPVSKEERERVRYSYRSRSRQSSRSSVII